MDQELSRAGITEEAIYLLFDPQDQMQVEQWIKQRVEVHSIAQKGVLESLMFVVVGLVGRTFSDKVVFGSVMGAGGSSFQFCLSESAGVVVLFDNPVIRRTGPGQCSGSG